MTDTDVVDIVWEEPPALNRFNAGRKVSAEMAAIAEALKSAPDKWARVATRESHNTAVSLASRIRQGKSAAFVPAGHFQATARTLGENESAVWACYVGEEGVKAAEEAASDPAKVHADKYSLADLKGQATSFNLSTAGTKPDIAKRVLEHVGPDYFDQSE